MGLTRRLHRPHGIGADRARHLRCKHSHLHRIQALGTILPSFIIILAIALFFQQFKDYPAVENIFKGIRPAVVALIAAPTFKMAKSAKISRYNIWIPAVSALLIWLLDFSPIYEIILSGLGGYLYGRYKNKTQTDEGGNKA